MIVGGVLFFSLVVRSFSPIGKDNVNFIRPNQFLQFSWALGPIIISNKPNIYKPKGMIQ